MTLKARKWAKSQFLDAIYYQNSKGKLSYYVDHHCKFQIKNHEMSTNPGHQNTLSVVYQNFIYLRMYYTFLRSRGRNL